MEEVCQTLNLWTFSQIQDFDTFYSSDNVLISTMFFGFCRVSFHAPPLTLKTNMMGKTTSYKYFQILFLLYTLYLAIKLSLSPLKNLAIYENQFSIFKSGTRSNSFTLFVTTVALIENVWAAINVSISPMGVPWERKRVRNLPAV